MDARDRARGALLGLAIGDALGTTLEFQTLNAPPFPTLAMGPHTNIVGGGPFSVAPGQGTDDTQMACCLAASIVSSGGKFGARDAAHRYREWATREPADIGNQTRAALTRVREGNDPVEAGRAVWLESGKLAAGNGSLMRTAPIGIAFMGDAHARRVASLWDSAITHYDPRCRLACAALNAAIAAMIDADPIFVSTPFDAAVTELDEAEVTLIAQEPGDAGLIAAAEDALQDDLVAARRADPGLYASDLHIHRTQGFVRVAFRLAFWELAHAPSFETGLIDTVNRGGDADTNGAIAGALLGAYYGEGAIPTRWRDAVLAAPPYTALGPTPEDYHARTLLALVEALV